MTGIVSIFCGLGSRSLTASPSRTSVAGYYRGTPATVNITTSLVAAVTNGGSPPYTYAWSQVGVSPYTWSITAPTAANTGFTAFSVDTGAQADAQFQCVVGDATGATQTIGPVSASCFNNGTGTA